MYALAGGLARAHGQARGHVRRVPAGAGRGAGADVVQLFDSWVGRPLRGRLPRVRRALLGARPRRRGGADDPLRDRHDAPAPGDEGGRRRRHRARLARPDRSLLGARSARAAACRGTSTRRSCSGPGSASRSRRSASSTRSPAAAATSSTSATASSRTPTRPTSAGSSSSCASAPPSKSPLDGRRDTRTAVILMAYGSPERLEDVPAYLADIRGGRPVRQEAVDELVERYRRIGGTSPLNRDHGGAARRARAGARAPRLRGHEALAPGSRRRSSARSADGAERLVGLVLAPHYSRISIGGYRERLEQPPRRPRRARLRRELARPRAVRRAPGRPRARHRRARRLHGAQPPRAHPRRGRSLPRPAARDLAPRRRPGRRRGAGRSRSRARARPGSPGSARTSSSSWRRCTQRGVRKVLVAPVGFVSDHLEILWDLDVEAREKAAELGLELDRIESLNDDPAFIRALADLVEKASESRRTNRHPMSAPPQLSRLARPPRGHARPPLQALHARRGAAAGGGARQPPGHPASRPWPSAPTSSTTSSTRTTPTRASPPPSRTPTGTR